MIDHSPHEGIKGEVEHLWQSNRPLAVTILLGLLIGGYILYKRSQSGGVTTPADTSSGLPASWSNTYVTENKTINVASPSPIAPVVGTPVATGQPIVGGNPQPGQNPVTGSSRLTPIIPYGQLPVGTRYSTAADLKAQPTLKWMGTTYTKVPGSHGLLWGNPVGGGQQVLLYGPPSAY